MHDSTFHRLRHLFDELVALTPQQRTAAVAARDDLDERTRQHLLDLLDMDAAVADLTARIAKPALHAEKMPRAGTRIGAYVIDAPLGAGGMGSVYRARREGTDIEQWVAIKVARRDALDEGTLARFRVERQVLALLQHPHIAAMYDVGELADGTPYIVMEYVQGQPLLDDADLRDLGLRERLELFVQLCDAVVYAHRNLIVHRDIKPSNVLVTAEGRPKLLDFGIAKPLDSKLGSVAIEKTLASERYFSLRNASPEQLRGDAIDVTCDVYGLGSLLYELLCGRPLYDFDRLTFVEVSRCILEQDPLPPSRRVAANDPRGWRRRLPRELDAIASMALRREPAARYASVDAFATDVRRYLAGFPVAATPNAWHYRTARFLRRNRIAVGTSLLFGVVAAAGLASWLQQYRSTLAERDRAEAVTRTILRGLDLTAPLGMRRNDVSVADLSRQVSRLASQQKAKEHQALRAQLLAMDAQISEKLGDSTNALSLLTVINRDLSELPTTLRDEIRLTHVEALVSTGDLDTAESLNQQRASNAASEIRRQLIDARIRVERNDTAGALAALDRIASTDSAASREQRWEARRRRGPLLVDMGLGQEAVASQLQLISDQNDDFDQRPSVETLATLQNALQVASNAHDADAAVRISLRTVQMCKSLFFRDGEYSCLVAADQRAIALADAGLFDQAEQTARKALAVAREEAHGESELSARFHYTLGEILRRRGSRDAADAFREAIRVGTLHLERGSATVVRYQAALLVALLGQGDRFVVRHEILAGLGMLATKHHLHTPQGELIVLIDRLVNFPRAGAYACRADVEQLIAQSSRRRMDAPMRTLYRAVSDVAARTSPLMFPWKPPSLLDE